MHSTVPKSHIGLALSYSLTSTSKVAVPTTISVSICVNILLLLNVQDDVLFFFYPDNDLLHPQEEANTDQPLPYFNFASEEELSKLGEG